MRVNLNLLWDCDKAALPDSDDPAFERFYVTRVLTNGTAADLRAVGFDRIRRLLPDLWLPASIREFWEWYFDLPHAQPSRRDPYTFSKRAA